MEKKRKEIIVTEETDDTIQGIVNFPVNGKQEPFEVTLCPKRLFIKTEVVEDVL